MTENGYALEVRGLTKSYPGVTALDNVDFTVKAGEVHVLVGENGAGKTTLVKVLCGLTQPDRVERFYIGGRAAEIRSPSDSLRFGVAAIQQRFSLVPEMTVADNIFLGREKLGRARAVDRAATEAEARKLLQEMGVDINPAARASRLDISHQQVVEICKALSQQPTLLLMDEPTSGLTKEESRHLFEVIGRLRQRHATILYISHRLEEVFEVGDRVTVLRNGTRVHEGNLSDITHSELTKAIVGREIGRRYPKEDTQIGAVRLSVEGLENAETRPRLKDVSFEIRAGEIVSIYGILGCGKDELADTLFGRTPATAGTLRVDGEERRILRPADAIAQGMGYLTEERHEDGLVELMSLRSNLTLPSLGRRFSRLARLLESEERQVAQEYTRDLRLHVPHTEVMAQKLSGGNQQKVVFGKWLLAEARILILNEPTKGIDVGSKVHMFELMTQEAKKGAAVLLLTAEAEEAVEMGDQILVMRSGRIAARFSRREVLEGKVSVDKVLEVATRQESD